MPTTSVAQKRHEIRTTVEGDESASATGVVCVTDNGSDDSDEESNDTPAETVDDSAEINLAGSVVGEQIVDISGGKWSQPIQPHLKTFRPTVFGKGKKAKHRSFNPGWFEQFSWLEYSVTMDAAYCYCCRHYSLPSSNVDLAFIKHGFRNWKRSTGKNGSLSTHNKSLAHKEAMVAWSDDQIRKLRGTTVPDLVVKDHSKLIKNNRDYMKTVASVLLLTAMQDLAQRGHDEGESSTNRGNFLAILHEVAKHDENVYRKLHGFKNAKYTHHSIQNDIIAIMAHMVRQEIAGEIASAGCFALQADESKDISKSEQISVVLRYVHNTTVMDSFLGFAKATGLDAQSLSDTISRMLKTNQIDIENCVAQCYDGASVMSGCVAGVQAKIRLLVPQAVYVHCYNHQLNLVVVDCVKINAFAAEFFSLLQQLYVFMTGSAVHTSFMEIQSQLSPNEQARELKKLSDTRWSCQHASVQAVKSTLPAIIETLSVIAEERTSAERSLQAASLLKFIDMRFAVFLVMFETILSQINIVSKQLQGADINLLDGVELVKTLRDDISAARAESEKDGGMWNKTWIEAEEISEKNDLPLPAELRGRRKLPSVRLQGTLSNASSGQRPNLRTSDDYRTQVFLPIIDRIDAELERRFSKENCGILRGLFALQPKDDKFLELNVLREFAVHYGANLEDLAAELHSAKRLLQRKNRDGELELMEMTSHLLLQVNLL